MKSLRDDALKIWNAGVDAVRARSLLHHSVKADNDQLQITDHCGENHHWNLAQFDRIIVVGAGKAATAMTEGLLDKLDQKRPIVGWINVPEGTEKPIEGITVHAARPAGVNEPTAEGVRGTEAILDLVGQAGPRDLCIALISGGGSALLPAPADGVSLADKLAITRFLSGAGADITELNTVRKHISRVKGGGLAAVSRAGVLVSLVLSDVLGDPLDLIASGPTVPDTSTPADAIEVLKRYQQAAAGDEAKSVQRIMNFLSTTAKPKTFDASNATTIVIGNNHLAVEASAARARELGYDCVCETATECEGLADEVGAALARDIISRLSDTETQQPLCIISGGEPTVRLAAADVRGKGGRNQHLVLAIHQCLVESGLSESNWRRISFLSGGTDGEDGPTDAAGGLIDFSAHQAIEQGKHNVLATLDHNNAYPLLQSIDALISTGATGTNVCDVRVILIDCISDPR